MTKSDDRSATLSYWMLIGFLAILWVAGGASRADVLGQTVTRAFAWGIAIAAILLLSKVNWRDAKAPFLFMGASALVLLAQLVPLPPELWTQLPGRSLFTEIAGPAGFEQPWRPMSISPEGTANALASLVVPVVCLSLAVNLTPKKHWRLALAIVVLAAAGTIYGILQFSGAQFANPLLNSASGIAVSGNFANRNHFSLFLSIGCVLAFTWALNGRSRERKIVIALVLVLLFVLVILAAGSRTGLLLAPIGVLGGLFLNRTQAYAQLQRFPRQYRVWLVAAILLGVTAITALSLYLGRAQAIDRAMFVEEAAGLRTDIWAVVWQMLLHYFPVGTGFGSFDPAFRIHEPDIMLGPKYVNQAHNDWLQVILEGGILGAVLVGVFVTWFVRTSWIVWRPADPEHSDMQALARAGSIIILMVMIASVPDYPARTPTIMAIVAISAVWMSKVRPARPNG